MKNPHKIPANPYATLAIRPLPLRIEPLPDESWRGYTHRVANRYCVPWADLMRPVLCCEYPRAHPRDDIPDNDSIGLLPATAALFADYFNLDAGQVRAMHLLPMLNAFYPPDPLLPGRYDPLRSRRPYPPGYGEVAPPCYVPQRSMTPHRATRRCAACQRDQPDYWALKWRFSWLPACPTHEIILTDDPDPQLPSAADVPASSEILTYQEEILALKARPEEARSALHELLVWAEFFAAEPRAAFHPNMAPLVAADALPAAWRCVRYGPDMSDLHRVALRRSPDAVLAEVLNRLPAALAIRDRPASWFPDLLPLHLYVAELADYLEAVHINYGRLIVGRLIQVASGVATWDVRLTKIKAAWLSQDLLAILADLEQHGWLDDFWWAAGRAAGALRTDDINYGLRRPLVPTRAVELAPLRWLVCGEDGSNLRERCRLYWACAYEPNDWASLDDRLDSHLDCVEALCAALDEMLLGNSSRELA